MTYKQDLIARMQRLPHFQNLTPDDLQAIVDSGQIKDYPAGQTLFFEDAPCAGLYVLLSGQVHVYKTGPEGQENLMMVIKPVIMLNEVAVLDGGPNPATAINNGDLRIRSIIFTLAFQLFEHR